MSKDRCSVCEMYLTDNGYKNGTKLKYPFRFNTCSKECAQMAVFCKTINGLFPERDKNGTPFINVRGRVDGLVREVHGIRK